MRAASIVFIFGAHFFFFSPHFDFRIHAANWVSLSVCFYGHSRFFIYLIVAYCNFALKKITADQSNGLDGIGLDWIVRFLVIFQAYVWLRIYAGLWFVLIFFLILMLLYLNKWFLKHFPHRTIWNSGGVLVLYSHNGTNFWADLHNNRA